MIEIRAAVASGMTRIEVTGHERAAGEIGNHGHTCAAVTAITRTAILGLHALAVEYPDLVSITVTEE